MVQLRAVQNYSISNQQSTNIGRLRRAALPRRSAGGWEWMLAVSLVKLRIAARACTRVSGAGQDDSFGAGQDDSFGAGQDDSFGAGRFQGPSAPKDIQIPTSASRSLSLFWQVMRLCHPRQPCPVGDVSGRCARVGAFVICDGAHEHVQFV